MEIDLNLELDLDDDINPGERTVRHGLHTACRPVYSDRSMPQGDHPMSLTGLGSPSISKSAMEPDRQTTMVRTAGLGMIE